MKSKKGFKPYEPKKENSIWDMWTYAVTPEELGDKPWWKLPEGFKSLEEAWEYTKSKEYKEKNFKREAIKIDPEMACQPFGAIVAASGIEGTMPYNHGSHGCCAYFRSELARHFREPSNAVSSSMMEDAAVFGGLANLTEGLKNAYTTYKPKHIAISTTCMSEVIGDDIKTFVERAKKAGAVPEDFPITFAHTPSFTGSHINGYDSMVEAMLSQLATPKEEKTGKINLIPGFDLYTGDLKEYKRIAKLMGIDSVLVPDWSRTFDYPLGKFELYPGGTPIEEVRNAVNNKGSILLAEDSLVKTGKLTKNKWKQPTIQLPMPIGIEFTDRLIMALSEMAGVEIPKEIEEERGLALDSMSDAYLRFHGVKFAIAGDPDMVYGVSKFLLEMGAKPFYVVSTNGSKKWEKKMQQLLDSSEFGKGCKAYAGMDLWQLRSLMYEKKPDAIIGSADLKYCAREFDIPHVRIGFPLMDRFNLHRYPIVGYKGVINMITLIGNTLLDYLDRVCPEENLNKLR